MEYILNGTFDSLTKRILYAYPAAYPQFVPVNCTVSTDAQKEMHIFMEKVLTAIYETPENFDFPIIADDYYEPWQLANTRPELMANMDKIENRFTAIITALIKVGKMGENVSGSLYVPKASRAVNKQTAELLTKLGVTVTGEKEGCTLAIPEYPLAFEAWKAYADADNENATKVDRTVTFIYGKYFGRVYTAAEFFTKFVPDTKALDELEDYYRSNGYTCGNYLLNGKTRYACTKWLKELPNGQNSYMSVSFVPRVQNQLKVEFHLPNFRRLVEEDFDSFDEKLKAFVFARLNNCSGCGYCTQTDKSGKRSKLARVMEFGGETKLKCPLFPNFNFGEINAEDMHQMRALCAYAEKKK